MIMNTIQNYQGSSSYSCCTQGDPKDHREFKISECIFGWRNCWRERDWSEKTFYFNKPWSCRDTVIAVRQVNHFTKISVSWRWWWCWWNFFLCPFYSISGMKNFSTIYPLIKYVCYFGCPFFLPLINSAPVLVWVSTPPLWTPSASVQASPVQDIFQN